MLEVSGGSPQRDVYSVARLNKEARDLLESSFQRLWVQDEISNLARPAFSHPYFTLKMPVHKSAARHSAMNLASCSAAV